MAEFSPNKGQQDALEAGLPLLVLAGAGTGKTTVLTHRIANLVAEGKARPDQILALTFADKAAAEMSQRLADLLAARGLENAGREVRCSTFHSFGAEIIRDYAPLLGMESDCRVLSTPECWQLLSRILDTMDFEQIELPMTGLGSVIGGMLDFFSRAKDHLVDPDRLQSFLSEAKQGAGLSEAVTEYWRARLAPLEEVAEAYAKYELVKKERGYLDYGDLLVYPVRLLGGHDAVRGSYQARFQYLFVDEYQDTNYAQNRMLMELLPAGAPIFVIGDDDQSIYGWRGAVLQNILRFGEEPAIKAAGLKNVKLTENRRSGEVILNVANRVIEGIDKPREYRKALAPMDGETIPSEVGHYVAASDESEAGWIARTIKEKLGAPEVEDPTGKKKGYGVFAILCRKRSLFPAIATALEEAEVPYELIGGTGFYGRWEIKDVLSYLRVLADPADNIALARILQSRSWRISDRDLFHLSQWSRMQARRQTSRRETGGGGDARSSGEMGSPGTEQQVEDGEGLEFRLFDALADHQEVGGLPPDAHRRLASLKDMLDSLAKSALRLSVAELVDLVIKEAGYRRELAVRRGVRKDTDSHLALLNLGKLVELARQFQGNEGNLAAFVEYVQYALESGGEESEVRPVDEGSNTVKVMTVHQAKGLEFPAVFLPGLVERIFPDPKVDDPDGWGQLPEELRGDREDYPALDLAGIETEEDLEAALAARKLALAKREEQEERRLFYVAVTRAQRCLFLSRAYWYFSNAKPRKPSPYWMEIVGGEDNVPGLSVPLGEEPDPGVNPKRLNARLTSETPVKAPGLARLLLQPDRGAEWIAKVAGEAPAQWQQRSDSIVRTLGLVAMPSYLTTAPASVAVSCSGLIQYDECPRVFRYLHVDQLPARPAPWTVLGTEVHRLIEERTLPLERREREIEVGDEDLDLDEHAALHSEGGPLSLHHLMSVFESSPFARRTATKVEEPFSLPVNGDLLRGRIDRLDRLSDGSWQLVDYKVSRFHGHVLRRQKLQLQMYSLAAWRLWEVDPASLTCYLLFLIDGHEEVLSHSVEELEQVEWWAAETLERIRCREYPRLAESGTCAHCGYGQVCRFEDRVHA